MRTHLRHLRFLITFPFALLLTVDITDAGATVFHCASGDTLCLVASIRSANAEPGPHTIILEPGTYTLTAVDNVTDGPNGLPSITSRLTIIDPQMGATIERDATAPIFRIFHVAAGGRLRLFGMLVRGGFIDGTDLQTEHGGGGIMNLGVLEIRRVIVAENIAFRREGNIPFGGGIFSNGRAEIIDSRIVDNAALEDIGGGGGIFAHGELNIARSDVNGNFATGGAGVLADGTINIDRSAIYENSAEFTSGLQVNGNVTITNSTIGRNATSFGFVPSAAISLGSGVLRITNSTIADNFGRTPSVGILVGSAGVVQLQNTILALNVSVAGTFQDCAGSVTSLGNNIIGTTFGCDIDLRPTDFVGDPRIGPLTSDADGNVFFPLLEDSPAIDTANRAACPRRDQLGQPRVDGNGDGRRVCDIGAVEFIP